MYKSYRCLICLFLVAVLAFNISPVKAQASSLAVGAVVGVAATVAVAVGLQALGIRAGTDSSVFNKLVDDCSAAISPQWAVNGLVTMLTFTQDGMPKTYLSQGFLQSVLDWLFDSGSLAASEEYIFPYTDYENIMAAYKEAMSHPYHYFTNYYTAWSFYFSDYPISLVDHGDGTFNISFTGEGGLYSIDSGGRCNYFYQSKGSGFGSRGSYYTTLSLTEITTVSDLTLESVGQNLDSDYVAYMNSGLNAADAGVSFTDDPSTDRDESEDNNQPWLPATIPSLNIGDYTDQSQSDAQSGLTSGTLIDDLIASKPGVDVEPGSILDWLSKIWDTIIGLPAAIAQALAQALADIFVPSSDFVTAKVEAIRARFDWITPIIDFAKSFQSAISGSEPPIIYVHLQNYEGPYNFGGTVKFLDMTWYSRYKSQGDAIISGFLWALLGWRLFMKLPGIINGAGGAVGSITYGRGKDD